MNHPIELSYGHLLNNYTTHDIFSPSQRSYGFDPKQVHVLSVVDIVAMGKVSLYKYFGFPPSLSFHQRSMLKFLLFAIDVI